MGASIFQTLLENNLCLSQSPNGTDKEHPKNYISRVYDPLLGKLSSKNLVFVEIGVRTGASVHLWSTFFRNLNFIGIDNNKDVVWQNENWLEGKNVKYLQADAYSLETIKKLPKEIDVIIDDGPHSLES